MKMPENRIDPELEKVLEGLRSVPARNPKLAQQGRMRFLSEAQTLRAANPTSLLQRLERWATSIRGQQGARLSIRQISMAIIIAVVVTLSGVSLTAYTAQDALPGEQLYSVKLTLEDAFLTISQSDIRSLNLHLSYAARRLDEISAMLDRGQTQEITSTTGRLAFHLESAATLLFGLDAGTVGASEETVHLYEELLGVYETILAGDTDDDGGKATSDETGENEHDESESTEGDDGSDNDEGGNDQGNEGDGDDEEHGEDGSDDEEHGEEGSDDADHGEDESDDEEHGEEGSDDAEHSEEGSDDAEHGEEGSDDAEHDDEEAAEDCLSDDEVRFEGSVAAITGQTWTINGKTVIVTSQTEINDTIVVGDLVEVRAFINAACLLEATRIRLVD